MVRQRLVQAGRSQPGVGLRVVGCRLGGFGRFGIQPAGTGSADSSVGAGALSCPQRPGRSSSARKASAPWGAMPVASTTGTPMARSSAARSSSRPCARTRSIMLTTSTIGTCSRQRRGQPQSAAQPGRIDDDGGEVGRALLQAAPQHDHRAGHGLVLAARVQAGAGQVDDRDAASGSGLRQAALELDGDAGVVADLLLAAGQAVEQRGLAAVRVAQQGQALSPARQVDGLRLAHAASSRIWLASAGRWPNTEADLHHQRAAPEPAAPQHP